MSAPSPFRLRALAPSAPTRWVKLSETRKGVLLTNFPEAAYVASRESVEVLARTLSRQREFKDVTFHVEPAP